MARRPRFSTGERWRIVFFRTEMQLSLKQIAKRVRCSVGEVHRILSTYYATDDILDRGHSGRPGVMTQDDAALLDRLITLEPSLTSAALVRKLLLHTGRRYDERTVRRYRHSVLQYHAVHERVRERLTAAHKTARVQFAQAHSNDNFHYVGFSDEKCFILKNTGNVVFIKRGQHIPAREVRDVTARVWVWGCVWYNHKSTLHTTRLTMNMHRYTSVLANHLLPSMPGGNRHLFMQDNSSVHTCPFTRNWLVANAVRVLPSWPAHSPELNAVEYVWNWMTAFVKKEAPTDRVSLKRAIRLAWQQLPQTKIRACIDHTTVDKNN